MAELWNSLPLYAFTNTYNLSSFKRQAYHYLQNQRQLCFPKTPDPNVGTKTCDSTNLYKEIVADVPCLPVDI